MNSPLTTEELRKGMLNSVIDDFTYKPGVPEQREMWNDVKVLFGIAETKVDELCMEIGDFLNFRAGTLKGTGQYIEYKQELRRAFRRFNAAIANDFDPNETVPIVNEIEYPGPIPEEVGREYYCAMMNIVVFSLITQLVQFVPYGRFMSIGRTVMEDVRGILIEMVNYHWTEDNA